MPSLTEVEIQRRLRNFWMDVSIDIVKRAVKPEQQTALIAEMARMGRELERELRAGRIPRIRL